jgi:hypothetical protein
VARLDNNGGEAVIDFGAVNSGDSRTARLEFLVDPDEPEGTFLGVRAFYFWQQGSNRSSTREVNGVSSVRVDDSQPDDKAKCIQR